MVGIEVCQKIDQKMKQNQKSRKQIKEMRINP